MEESFEVIHDNFIDEMKEVISGLVRKKGKESKHFSEKVLKPNDNIKIYLNTHYDGYVSEIGERYLISNEGNLYDHSCISTEELCKLTDHLVKKYK